MKIGDISFCKQTIRLKFASFRTIVEQRCSHGDTPSDLPWNLGFDVNVKTVKRFFASTDASGWRRGTAAREKIGKHLPTNFSFIFHLESCTESSFAI